MPAPEQKEDSITEAQNEILKMVLATTKELQDVVAIVNELGNVNEVDNQCKKLAEIQKRLQVIADNEIEVMKSMRGLLRRNWFTQQQNESLIIHLKKAII